MTLAPEELARLTIDELLEAAGWHVCDLKDLNLTAHRGIAVREFPLPGHGFADYLLYVDGKAAGIVEAKKVGSTLIGVEVQSAKYTDGLPASLPAWERPLPFAYESTGVETRFTNSLDPEPRSRLVFSFYRPSGLAKLLELAEPDKAAEARPEYIDRGRSFLARINNMPNLIEEGLWGKQAEAIKNIETSLRKNHPRALAQMATGSGKTFSALTETNKHFTLKTAPLQRKDLDEFVACYNTANRHDRKATWSEDNPQGRWRSYEYSDPVARDKSSLDIFWLKDESLEDSDNLPAPGIIAAEIVEDLESALEQMRLTAEDLGEPAGAQAD